MPPPPRRRPRGAAPLAWCLVGLAACGAPPPAEPAAAPPAAPEAPSPPGWALHEWGLIGIAAAAPDAAGAALAGPVAEVRGHADGSGIGVGYAPVVYAHLLGDAPDLRFSLRVALAPDAVPETWPPAARSAEGASWADVRARRAAGPCAARYPAEVDEACRTADGLCEAAGAAAYASEDGACLDVDGTPADFLLYRARVARAALPYDVRFEDGTPRLVARDDAAPRAIYRVRRSFVDQTVALVPLSPPAPGARAPLAEPVPTEPAAALALLLAGLTEAGLTDAEQAAFRAAWRDAFVPETAPTLFPPSVRGELACAARPAADAVFYWLGPDAERVLPLAAEPAPAERRRALLVRLSLDPPPLPPRFTDYAADPTLDGARGLAADLASRVVRRGRAPLSQCADLHGPWERGTLRVHATLAASGQVQTAEVEAAPPSEGLAECAALAVRRWTFPAPSEEGASVDFTVALRGRPIESSEEN